MFYEEITTNTTNRNATSSITSDFGYLKPDREHWSGCSAVLQCSILKAAAKHWTTMTSASAFTITCTSVTATSSTKPTITTGTVTITSYTATIITTTSTFATVSTSY